MPISRYQLRSEYSLADPELYRSADRDDPEALLEGVAMAGLVGVLRQLGDLAEFASEIFHELHEEVMATAARGHGLMIRVQQLEAEFPSIEKAFLSQASHSDFIENAGIHWHANLRMDQNLITQGDLPRFIMDSYEECRGPPRLFLLDKFDVAGAGACLKRYSDPSFYKTELASIETKKAKVQREKKSRKIKKRGLRLRKGDTPGVFSTSQFNSMLHQLSSDEKKMPEKIPTYGVKLKKGHLNSASFISKTGRSYMEHILEIHPFEDKTAVDNSWRNSHLKIEPDDVDESGPEIYEISEDSTNEHVKERAPVLLPRRQVPEPIADELAEDINQGGNLKSLPEVMPDLALDNSATFHQVSQKCEVVGGGRKTGASVDGCRSGDSLVEEIPTAFNEEDDANDESSTKSRLAKTVRDEFDKQKNAASIQQMDRKDDLIDGTLKPEVDTDSYMSDEFEVEKAATTSHLVYQKDLPVDGERKIDASADVSISENLDVENIPMTFYQVGENDAFDDGKRKDATVDRSSCDDIEVEKFPTILHRLDHKDVFVCGESRIDGNADGNMPVDFEVEKKPPTVNDDSGIQSLDDEYGSTEIVEKMPSTIDYLEKNGAFVDDEIMTKVVADGYMSDDATSEMDNYMDALTTMESEMETDTDGRARHEMGLFNVISHEMDSDINEEQELQGQCSDTHSIGGSSTTFSSNSSFKKERANCSSDSLSNLADMQSPKGNGTATADMAEKSENSFKFKDSVSGSMHESSCVEFCIQSANSIDGDAETEANAPSKSCPTEIHDISSKLLSSNGKILKTKSVDCIAPIETGKEESDSHHVDLVSTFICQSTSASLNDNQLARSDPSEISSTYNEDSTSKISGLKLEITEVPPTEFSENFTGIMLVGERHDPSLYSLPNSSDITDIPGGSKENDALEVPAIDVTTECSSDYLQAAKVCDLHTEPIHDSSLERVPTECVEGFASAGSVRYGMLDSSNSKFSSLEERLCIKTEQGCPDALLDGESPPECLPVSHTNLVENMQANCLVVEMENGATPSSCSENLKPANEVKESSELMVHEHSEPNTSILPLESESCYCGDLCESHVTDLAEVPSLSSRSETLASEKLEVLSNTLEIETDQKDTLEIAETEEPLLESIHPNSTVMMGNTSDALDLPSVSVASNAPLLELTNKDHTQLDDYPSVAVASNPPLHELSNEDSTWTDDLESGCSLAANNSNDSSEPIHAPDACDNHIQLQEESFNELALTLHELEINEAPKHENQLESDAQMICALFHSENGEALPEFAVLDCSSDYLCHFAQDRQSLLLPRNGPECGMPWSGSDQDSELKSMEDSELSSLRSVRDCYPHEGAKHTASLEQGIELEVVGCNCVPSLHAEEEHGESAHVLLRRKEMDPPDTDLQHRLEHEKPMDPCAVHDTILDNEVKTSSSPLTISTSLDPEASNPLQPDQSLENSELSLPSCISSVPMTSSLISPSIDLLTPETINQGSSEAETCISSQTDHTLSSELTSCNSSVPSISTTIFPTFGLFASGLTHQGTLESEINKSLDISLPVPNVPLTNLEEMPPLPPLPPLEWRIGKIRHGFPTLEGEMTQPLDSFSQLLTIKDEKSQCSSLLYKGDMSWHLNPFTPLPTIKDDKPQYGPLPLVGEMVQPSDSLLQVPIPGGVKPSLTSGGEVLQPSGWSIALSLLKDNKDNYAILASEGVTQQPLNPLTHLQNVEHEKPKANLHLESNQSKDIKTGGGEEPSLALEGQMLQPPSLSMSTPGAEDENTLHMMPALVDVREQSLNSFLQLQTVEDEKPKDNLHLGSNPESPHHMMRVSEGFTEQPLNPFLQLQTVEDEKPKGNLHLGPNQPKDPLIEAIASHDRSMLRKASERIKPVTRPKSDDRNSLLEQIRAKSFNLKPTVVTKPVIQGPQTNLNVVAILEKANAIRQAFAGSDEDDDSESWSDS